MLSEGEGNLLDADVDALVNTVNTVGVMGKGIALQFKQAYPDNFRAYQAACRRGEVRLGAMFTYETGLWAILASSSTSPPRDTGEQDLGLATSTQAWMTCVGSSMIAGSGPSRFRPWATATAVWTGVKYGRSLPKRSAIFPISMWWYIRPKAHLRLSR
jgi:hypothetical protein